MYPIGKRGRKELVELWGLEFTHFLRGETRIILRRKSTRFRLACRGDGSRSRLAHESTFAGPT